MIKRNSGDAGDDLLLAIVMCMIWPVSLLIVLLAGIGMLIKNYLLPE